MLKIYCDSGGGGLRNQSPSSSEFISNGPAPAGANRGPPAKPFVIIYLHSSSFCAFFFLVPDYRTVMIDYIIFLLFVIIKYCFCSPY